MSDKLSYIVGAIVYDILSDKMSDSCHTSLATDQLAMTTMIPGGLDVECPTNAKEQE